MSRSVRNYPEPHQLELLENVTDLLKRSFSSDFVFPSLGHDDPHKLKNIGEMWRLWLPPESMHTFEKGTYHHHYIIPRPS